jgi:PAS domain S-box-containing protein
MATKLQQLNKAASRVETDVFFSMSDDLMIILDFEGQVMRLNEAWVKVFQFSMEELLESNANITLQSGSQLMAEQLFDELASGSSKALDYTQRMFDKQGNEYVFAWNLVGDNNKQLIYGIGRDMTSNVELINDLRDNQERFKFLSDNNNEAVLVTVTGQIQLYNKAFMALTGYSETELDGMDDQLLIAEEDRDAMMTLVNRRSEETYVSRMLRKNGDIIQVEVVPRNIKYKEQYARLVLIRNLDEIRQREASRKETENWFKALFENAAFGVVVMDTNGNILQTNSLISEKLQFSKEEFTGKNIESFIHQEDFPVVLENFQALVSGKSLTNTGEERLLRKQGGYMWGRVICTKVELAPGNVVVMSLIEDIESEIQDRDDRIKAEKRFETIFKSSPSGIIISRNEGEIIHVNPTFANMVGERAEQLEGANIFDFTYEEDLKETKKLLQMLNKGKINEYDIEKRYVKKNGEVFWAKTLVSLMERDGDDVYRVAVVENIDRRKKAEQKLEEKNKELTEINQELEHFAYVASHDLQEPLRTIASFIQILNKRYGETLDEDGKQFMGFVVEGAKRMQLLIRDLLEYSRVNRFNTDYEKVDLNEVFNKVNRVLKEKIDSTDALILAENLPVIQGNKIQLTQVFQNLIDNAIKFRGKKKPEITITVEELPSKWRIAVSDNGIGISPEYHQRIFIIFQRLHTHEEYTGTGIGLALCKKIIERHGGEVWVESKKNKGTTFTFTIKKNLIRAIG